MPLQDGKMVPTFYGNTTGEQATEKLAQMHRDLRHIQHALHTLEQRMKSKAPSSQLTSEFTLLYNWCVSLMETLFALTWASYDRARTQKVIADFETKFKTFTTASTVMANGRQ